MIETKEEYSNDPDLVEFLSANGKEDWSPVFIEKTYDNELWDDYLGKIVKVFGGYRVIFQRQKKDK